MGLKILNDRRNGHQNAAFQIPKTCQTPRTIHDDQSDTNKSKHQTPQSHMTEHSRSGTSLPFSFLSPLSRLLRSFLLL